MEKYEVISELMRIYDENIELKHKVSNCVALDVSTPSNDDGLNVTDRKVLEFGKKKLFDEVCHSYRRSVSVSRNEETGEIEVQTFKKWRSDLFNESKIPGNMSKQEINDYLADQFAKTYEEERKKAFEDLKIEETE